MCGVGALAGGHVTLAERETMKIWDLRLSQPVFMFWAFVFFVFFAFFALDVEAKAHLPGAPAPRSSLSVGRHHIGLCLPPSGFPISSASPGPKPASQDVHESPLRGRRWPKTSSLSDWHCHSWLISTCPCVRFREVMSTYYLVYGIWSSNLAY